MAKKEFKFLEAYRTAAPAVEREIVEARQKGHDSLYPLVQQMDRFYELCRISFGLPFDKDVTAEWFEKTVKETDNHFSLEIDKAEAALIASLLLRDLVWRGNIQCPLACLAVSFCGRREPAGGGALLAEAREALNTAGNERRISLPDKKIMMPAAKNLKTELDAIQPNQGPTIRAALEAVSSDLRGGATKLAEFAYGAFASLRSDATRLAEEVDMLWWYIGDWSSILDKSRARLAPAVNSIASAAELADFVRSAPGPHGVYGMLHRALGEDVGKDTTLKSSIESISSDELKRLAKSLSAAVRPLLPVQAAINLATERGTRDWDEPLRMLLGDVPLASISHLELAIQTFRERVLIGMGGLE